MLGSWSGIIRSHRIRGWQEVRLSIKSEFAETNNLVVDLRALIRGFRTPALCGTVVRDAGAGVRKPPKEETAGRKGAVWLAAIYGDLRIADATRASARRPVERRPIGGRNEGDPVRW